MNFFDLETGNIFDGKNHIFWFPNGQSTNLIYVQKIGVISDDYELSVKSQSPIFSLVNPNKIKYTQYQKLEDIKTNEYISKGTPYNNFYAHVIYVLTQSDSPGEYRDSIQINDEFITVGADFYQDEESLRINLSNFGIEIPNSIQKAFYDTNISEYYSDNILLNRKWKELLSNYWDIIANRGSYKSLVNALKWFEWGDAVTLQEVWKKHYCGSDRYNIKDLQSTSNGLFSKEFEKLEKTTYLSLQYALSSLKKIDGNIIYEEPNGNPVLERVASCWSSEELSLKLCLLGNFYETYFMPIHLDLIHSTISDVVYTDTFKHINGTLSQRVDIINNDYPMECTLSNNTSENPLFNIHNVEAYVNEDTFLKGYYKNSEYAYIGVDMEQKFPMSSQINGNINYYHNPGEIIKVKLSIDSDQDIKNTSLRLYHQNTKIELYTSDYSIWNKEKEFYILCQWSGDYDLYIDAYGLDGSKYISKSHFHILSNDNIELNIYKIQSSDVNFENNNLNDNHIGLSQNGIGSIYRQYLPVDEYGDGVKLSHLLIYEKTDGDLNDILSNEWLKDNYFLYTKMDKYVICISKEFFHHPENIHIRGFNVYRNDYIFVPEFHKLKEICKGDNINDFTINQTDALCVKPIFNIEYDLIETEWEFRNVTNGKIIKLKSIEEPFVANNVSKLLDPGYYDIVFKYKYKNGSSIIEREFVRDSAFLIKK